MIHTPFCAAAGVRLPIVQAPVGSATTPELAAAVSQAGGLGMLALSWRTAAEIRERMRATAALTRRPFGVNLVLAWPQMERLRVCLDEGARIVSLFWGDPAPYVRAAHAAGALVLHSAGTAAEARRAVDAGVDVIVAQGWEAGGHVRGEVSTLALVPRVVDEVGPVPVLAAGGITDGRGIAAALALGAAGVWMGTRFLATREAAAHPRYHAALLQASEDDTVHSSLFDGGWPDAPHRAWRNSTVRAWEAAGRPAGEARPGAGEVIARRADGAAVLRYEDTIPVPGTTGDVDALPLYMGQGVGLIDRIVPAGELVRSLAADAARALRSAARRMEVPDPAG